MQGSRILAEGERLTTLINDLLDLEKIQAGKMRWKMEPLQVEDIIHHAAAATAPSASAASAGVASRRMRERRTAVSGVRALAGAGSTPAPGFAGLTSGGVGAACG